MNDPIKQDWARMFERGYQGRVGHRRAVNYFYLIIVFNSLADLIYDPRPAGGKLIMTVWSVTPMKSDGFFLRFRSIRY
jgi:hypothetical protein